MRANCIKTPIILCAVITSSILTVEAQQSKMVAEWRDGDYVVRRYVVTDNKPHTEEYEIHYAINQSQPQPSYEDNDVAMREIDNFFKELQNDTLRHVKAITIIGYASPDGTTPYNTSLARQRAQQLGEMLDKQYNLNKRYNVVITSHVEPWSATASAIESSTLGNRSDLVRIVNSHESAMSVDNRLKQQGKAWAYLTRDVLPDMRRSVVEITYTEDMVDTEREYSPAKSNTPNNTTVVEEYVIVEPSHHKRKHANEWDGIIIDLGAASEGYTK